MITNNYMKISRKSIKTKNSTSMSLKTWIPLNSNADSKINNFARFLKKRASIPRNSSKNWIKNSSILNLKPRSRKKTST